MLDRDEELYFAYGSNLSSPRLRARTPSARVVAGARLTGFAVRYAKRGTDGSGKCTLVAEYQSVVEGAVFRIARGERPALDRVEGLNAGYAATEVDVATEDGIMAARTYIAQPAFVDHNLRPYDWYRVHVLVGAREHGLSRAYVDGVLNRAPLADRDRVRARRELSIYPSLLVDEIRTRYPQSVG